MLAMCPLKLFGPPAALLARLWLAPDVVQKVIKHNYDKGNYEGMRQSSQINWKELLLQLHNDIDTMWLTFKHELQHRTLQFIPTMRNTWKEEGYKRAH